MVHGSFLPNFTKIDSWFCHVGGKGEHPQNVTWPTPLASVPAGKAVYSESMIM